MSQVVTESRLYCTFRLQLFRPIVLEAIWKVLWYVISIRSLVLYMNPWDSIVILIKISWGIYWPTLYLPNLSNSLLHQTITMAYFIRSLIYLFLNVLLWAELRSHHEACKCKQISENGFSPCKNSFYVKSFRLLKQWFSKIWKI